MAKKSIIKQSSTIRKALHDRFKELNLTYNLMVAEAEKFGVKGVKPETISRYFKEISHSSLTEEGIVFLCIRYGIPISLNVGALSIDGNNIKRFIPKYNEQKAIEQTKKIFQTVNNSTVSTKVVK